MNLVMSRFFFWTAPAVLGHAEFGCTCVCLTIQYKVKGFGVLIWGTSQGEGFVQEHIKGKSSNTKQNKSTYVLMPRWESKQHNAGLYQHMHSYQVQQLQSLLTSCLGLVWSLGHHNVKVCSCRQQSNNSNINSAAIYCVHNWAVAKQAR